MKNFLVFYGSPRKGGNSHLLGEALSEGARSKGAEVKEIRLFPLKITPCIECGKCDETGVCILEDDMTSIYPLLEKADVVVVSSPIFFYNITAKTQALVERSQALWVRKYVLKKEDDKERLGVFLSVGATKGKLLFNGARLVMKYFFDAIGARLHSCLLIKGVEKKAQIKEHPYALESAKRLGGLLAEGGDVSSIEGIWLPNSKK